MKKAGYFLLIIGLVSMMAACATDKKAISAEPAIRPPKIHNFQVPSTIKIGQPFTVKVVYECDKSSGIPKVFYQYEARNSRGEIVVTGPFEILSQKLKVSILTESPLYIKECVFQLKLRPNWEPWTYYLSVWLVDEKGKKSNKMEKRFEAV